MNYSLQFGMVCSLLGVHSLLLPRLLAKVSNTSSSKCLRICLHGKENYIYVFWLIPTVLLKVLFLFILLAEVFMKVRLLFHQSEELQLCSHLTPLPSCPLLYKYANQFI